MVEVALTVAAGVALGLLAAGLLQARKPADDRPLWVATQTGWAARRSSRKASSPPARTARR